MSKVAGCGAITLAMILVVGACSSSVLKGGTGGAGAGGAGAKEGTGGATGKGGYAPGGSEGYDHGGSGAGGMGTGGEGAHGGSGAGGQDAGSPDAHDGSPDAISCCPPDPDPSRGGTATLIGQVYLGGPRLGFNACGASYDFFCTTNWRLEADQYGCPVWRWDTDLTCRLDGSSNHFDAGDGGN